MKKVTVSDDQRKLAKGTFYSYINTYYKMIFVLLTNFLIARLIFKEEWGFLLLATSYIVIATLILIFLPPSFGQTMNFYIPKYKALNENNKLRQFINKALLIRFIFVIPMFLFSLLIFIFLFDFFEITLHGYTNLLIILAPFFIVKAMDEDVNDIHRGFNNFNYITIYLIIKSVLTVGALVYCFLNPNFVTLELVALVIVYTALIPFIINLIIVVIFVNFKIGSSNEETIKVNEVFKNLFTYGSKLAVPTFLTTFSHELETQWIGYYESSKWVTGFIIGQNYTQVPKQSSGTLQKPLTVSYSGMKTLEKDEEVIKTYIFVNKYAILIESFFAGIFFFFTDVFLYFFYGESYLVYSFLIKILILATVFAPQLNLMMGLLRSDKNVKYIPHLSIIFTTIRLVSFFIGLIFYGIIGAAIAILIGSIIILIISIIVPYKLYNIKVDLRIIIIIYSIFFISILITIFLNELYLNNLNSIIIDIEFLKIIPFLAILCFVLLFGIFIIILKIITKSDLNFLYELFSGNKKIHRYIKKSITFIKKFLRD